jgi:nucleoside-diphosphate-sugar epimerase
VKALVTGGLGFIGGHLSARLLAAGFEVHAYDNAQRGMVDGWIEALRSRDGYRLTLGNLEAAGALDEVGGGYTHVFHLAAIVGVENVIRQPYRVLRDNVLTLARLIDWSRTQSTLRRFVFPSTSEVYAGTLEAFGMKIPTPESTPLTITDLGRPRTSYMLSKIYGEALCRHAGVPFTIIRPHNVYGPRMGMAHVVPELLERAYRTPPGGTLKVFSPGHKRTFCYVDDAVELILRTALAPAGLNQTFNIGSADEEISIAALAKLIVETVHKPLKIEPGPETPGSPTRRRPDMQSTVSVASYVPSVALADGLRRTYDWYLGNVFEADYAPGLRGASPKVETSCAPLH